MVKVVINTVHRGDDMIKAYIHVGIVNDCVEAFN